MVLFVTSMGAREIYAWNYLEGLGSPTNARRLIEEGEDLEKLQAMGILYEDIRSSISSLRNLAETGSPEDREIALRWLSKVRELLN